MNQKQPKGKATGMLSDLMSFVVTLTVIAFCLALLVALFNGGLGGAQDLLAGWLSWFGEQASALPSRLTGTAAGGVS